MIATVVDTHTLIWYLSRDPRLSQSAVSFLKENIDAGNQLAVSTISVIEIIYLSEKGRLAPDWPSRVFGLLQEAGTPFLEIPVDLAIAQSAAAPGGSGIADMPDRIIAATALRLHVPLVTRDRSITNSSVNTRW